MKKEIKIDKIVIKVYLDYGSATEWIATFSTESLYMQCLDVLENLAKTLDAELVDRVVNEGSDDE
tara:strand:- start:1922 stop:2116 length:195 start_codon:yes stop_codon:yes gene_type:complete